VGVGKNEIVMSEVMWLMTKMVKEREEESGKSFRIKYGERAIEGTLELMGKNVGRRVEGEEEELEKIALSMSCLHFLKFASQAPDMKKYLLNKQDFLKRILYLDQSCTSPSF